MAIDVFHCSALSCNGLSGAANPCNEETNLANLVKLRMSCRETLGERNSMNEFLQWGDLEMSCYETMNAK